MGALRFVLLAGLVVLTCATPASASPSRTASFRDWRQERVRRSVPGISSTPSASKPHWACPEGPCELIVDPRPAKVHGRFELPGGRLALEGGGELGGFDPEDLRSAYKIPTGVASTQTVAVIEFGGYPNAESDLAKYREKYHLPACTKASGCFRKDNQKGEEANYPPASSGWEEESAIDADMVSAACPECHILMVETPANSLGEFLEEMDDVAVGLGATEVSNSWDGSEEDCQIEPELCTYFQKDFEHPGIPIVFAAGDGGYDNEYEGGNAPLFPATSPTVIAVGGTALYKDAGPPRGWREEVWRKGGGGCSKLFSKPRWQTDTGCAKRMDDDVSAVGASETPVSYYDSGWRLGGGTSVGTPLVAGILAHASAYARSLGAEAFYEDPAALFDVTEGFDWDTEKNKSSPCAADEYFCNALVGYDGPTGLGSPDGVPLGAPTVETKAASGVTQTGATLNATVDPNGSEVTECVFEYGSSLPSGDSVPCSPAPGSGSSPVTVTGSLSGLSVDTSYEYRVIAKNEGGTSIGAAEGFTTPPYAAPEFGGCVDVGAHSGRYSSSACTKAGGKDAYEWDYGVGKPHFTTRLASGTIKLETAKAFRITCTDEAGSGEYTGLKAVGHVVIALTGCEAAGEKCSSGGAAAGEAVTGTLEGVLGVEKAGAKSTSNKIALALFPAGRTGSLLKVACGSTTVAIGGALLVPVVADKAVSSTALKFSAKKGKQKPESFAGGPREVLEASINGAGTEQIGLTASLTQTSEEPIEISAAL